MLLYALAQIPLALLAPTSWRWPERLATRVLDEGSPWEAGQHLMQTAAPESWGVIVAAAPLADGNREAIQTCREKAAKAKQAVRCTIEEIGRAACRARGGQEVEISVVAESSKKQ